MTRRKGGATTDDPTVPAGDPEPPWAALIETLPAAVYIDRLDGTSVWVIPQIESVVGCTRAEWSSGYGVWSERIHPDDRERAVARSEEVMPSCGPPRHGYRTILAEGRA